MDDKFSFLSGSLALENKPFHFQIAGTIQNKLKDHKGYVGYKLTTLGRSSDQDVPSFIVVSQQIGILLIDVVEDRIIDVIERRDADYWRAESGHITTSRVIINEIYEEEVQSRLKNDLALYDRKTRRSKVPVRSVIVFCANDKAEQSDLVNIELTSIENLSFDEIDAYLDNIPLDYNCSEEDLGKIYSLIEGTFVYENKDIPIEEKPLTTINDYIQKSLQTTFKQDDAQRRAAMQLPPGPQRIRGLAGTGKTIVLCLKAAITHKKFPDFKILYLFNTQSLYQHVQSLISRYYTLEAKKAPDFDTRIDVYHAWGGRQRPGLYSSLCQKMGITPLTFQDVRGSSDALGSIYRDLLLKVGDKIQPEYDLVLIDEAQDFSNEIFQVAYKLAKGEGQQKRIIWAYDEFQSLRDSFIKGPSELFGSGTDGKPNLPDTILNGSYEGGIPKDFVLPNCYRTPRPVLMTAHGVAMGIYSKQPSEMFYYAAEWNAIGYRVNEPRTLEIHQGDQVDIERPDENSKNLLEGILNDNRRKPLNLIQTHTAENEDDQLTYISQSVKRLIDEHAVAPEEIIVINLRSGNNKSAMLAIQRALTNAGVKSVLPGYVESADVFKPKGFVTITTPFRAKGNEANIVFVLNAQLVVSDFTLRMRNAFFVAVTRSRGWCYITGYGTNMASLTNEIEAIKQDFPRFKFACPDPAIVNSNKTFLNKTDKELDELQRALEIIEKHPELSINIERRK
ncbi:DEAD/DEAH box helicase [Pseudomonas oryzihabitans]|uniref:DEAD/DEAH box helicase n=1 Tax=Pseudomonas oryzihabitans TaxID=47885 RepID=UPI00142ED58C|nr:ATP-binding domain-containing protein [Pseudomonas psychrotolerans]